MKEKLLLLIVLVAACYGGWQFFQSWMQPKPAYYEVDRDPQGGRSTVTIHPSSGDPITIEIDHMEYDPRRLMDPTFGKEKSQRTSVETPHYTLCWSCPPFGVEFLSYRGKSLYEQR